MRHPPVPPQKSRKKSLIFLETPSRRAEYLAIETGELTSPIGGRAVYNKQESLTQTKEKMDPKVFASQPRRIGGSGKVSILNSQYLDPEYEDICRSDWKATPTGLVTLVGITPKKEKNLPSFVLRWDTNSNTVDVDIYVDGKNRMDLWHNPGYGGHHTTRIKGPWRKFEVNIKIPERNIFRGVVNIGLLIEVNHKLEIELTDTGKFLLTSNFCPHL